MIPQTTHKKKCMCGNKNKLGSCKNCSRVKMVIALKNGADDFKLTMPNGKKVNPVKYSFIKNNNQPQETICIGMHRRFMKKDVLRHVAQTLLFYSTESNQLIAKVNL